MNKFYLFRAFYRSHFLHDFHTWGVTFKGKDLATKMCISELFTFVGYLHTAGFKNRRGINFVKCSVSVTLLGSRNTVFFSTNPCNLTSLLTEISPFFTFISETAEFLCCRSSQRFPMYSHLLLVSSQLKHINLRATGSFLGSSTVGLIMWIILKFKKENKTGYKNGLCIGTRFLFCFIKISLQ